MRLRDWAHTISALWETAATLLLIGPPLVTFGHCVVPFGPPLISDPALLRKNGKNEIWKF